MHKLSRSLAVATGLLWLSVPSAGADPIVIQQGFFRAAPSMELQWWNPPVQLFDATVRETSIHLFENISLPASPTFGDRVSAGQSVTTTRTFDGSGRVFLFFPSPTEPYSLPVPTASFEFRGADFVVPAGFPPAPVGDEDLYFVRQAFTMHGSFTFLGLDGTRQVRDLTGGGTAYLGLQPDRTTGESIVQSIGYSFERQAPSAVPEPATIVLFTFGTAGLIGRRLVRRW